MILRQTITRTVEGTTHTLDYGTITLIATRREHARGAGARDNAFILRDLRNTVADRMGIDKRTAHYVLASIKYSQLFTA